MDKKAFEVIIPSVLVGAICLFLIIALGYRSANLLFGANKDFLLQPKTCVEFKVLTKSNLEGGDTRAVADISFIIRTKENPVVVSDNKADEILALKNDCYYAKDVLSLRESISQEESISVLALFVPIFALIMTALSYFWVNTWKKDVEKIKADSKLESIYFSKLLRRIEEVGARYSSYLMGEEINTIDPENSETEKDMQTVLDAMQASREIENNLLILSNNSHSDNGKTNISLRSLSSYISEDDISNHAPYLLPLRDVLILIESQSDTSDNAKNSINQFIEFIEGKSKSFKT